MTNFRIGQRVVCVDAVPLIHPTNGEDSWGIVKGEVYTIRSTGFHHVYQEATVWLNEVVRDVAPAWPDYSFAARRFRPIAEKPASMDIIRSIVLDPHKPIPDDPREPKRIKTPEEIASLPNGIR